MSDTELLTVSRADLDAVATGDLDPDDVPDRAGEHGWVEPVTTRRAALAALAVGAGSISTLAGSRALSDRGGAQITSGQLGTANRPYTAAYLAELRGPLVSAGSAITSLLNHELYAVGDNVGSVDDDTLVFRYPEG